jgi:hypothetical protein
MTIEQKMQQQQQIIDRKNQQRIERQRTVEKIMRKNEQQRMQIKARIH